MFPLRSYSFNRTPIPVNNFHNYNAPQKGDFLFFKYTRFNKFFEKKKKNHLTFKNPGIFFSMSSTSNNKKIQFQFSVSIEISFLFYFTSNCNNGTKHILQQQNACIKKKKIKASIFSPSSLRQCILQIGWCAYSQKWLNKDELTINFIG